MTGYKLCKPACFILLSMLLQGSAEGSGAPGGDNAVRTCSLAVSAVIDTTCAPSPPVFPGADMRLDLANVTHRPGGARRHAGRLATLNVPELPQLPQETTAAGTAVRRHHSRLPVVAFTAMGQILWPLEAS